MRKRIRLLVVAVAVAAFALDLVRPQPATGTISVLAMLMVIAASWRRIETAGERASLRIRLARLPRLRLAIMLIMAGLAVARAVVVALPWLRPGLDIHAAQSASRLYVVLFAIAALIAIAVNAFALRIGLTVMRLSHRPALLLVGSFALLIGTASLLLLLPFAVRRMTDVSLIDSIFTATSAVCVTGLVVNDIATTYTVFGQIVILAAIQLGGIGMMTLAAFALGSQGSLSQQSRYCEMLAVRGLVTSGRWCAASCCTRSPSRSPAPCCSRFSGEEIRVWRAPRPSGWRRFTPCPPSATPVSRSSPTV